MRTSPRSPVGTERLFWKIPGDEREHSREIAVVMLFPTWQMLDPEAPFGWRTRNFPGLASRSNHKHVHFGFQRWHSRPAVPLHGVNAERRAVTSWRHRSEAGSPRRHRGLTGCSRAFERMRRGCQGRSSVDSARLRASRMALRASSRLAAAFRSEAATREGATATAAVTAGTVPRATELRAM
jgi:hypothetical protein